MKMHPERLFLTSPRLKGIAISILGMFLLLAAYLWHIQILNGAEYLDMARKNRVRVVRMRAPRGSIYDREGKLLVDNKPSFDVEVIPEDVTDMERTEERLSRLLGMDGETVRKRVRGPRAAAYLPLTVKGDATLEEALAVEERQPMFGGVRVGVYPRRRYVHGATAAHLLGYLGMINRDELERLRSRGYTRQDLIGKAGIEKGYERFLAGRAGEEGIQVDNRGYLDKVLYRQEAEEGCSLHLALDLKTQQAAESILEEGGGAVVALDPRNGDVLALASGPAYDPNAFIPPVDNEIVRDLISHSDHPLVNRAVQGLYPPGSTFKPIVALAALESGMVRKNTTFECAGLFTLGRHPYKCWLERGHRRVDVVNAMMFSCNVFFYNAGLRAGREEMTRMASEFGLDELSGIDLPGEKAGVLPTDDWLEDMGIKRWNPGDSVVMAIGQGYLLVTPLREAVMMAAIANGGKIYKPRVVKQVISPLGDVVERRDPQIVREVPLHAEDLALVREGLTKVVGSNYGTGQKARLKGITMAGKTGTVQVGPEGKRKNHAWFIGYAPCDDPQIAVAVILEGKESGGFFAAPAAKKVFAAHFGVNAEDPTPVPTANATPKPAEERRT
jgi:penicillin-binding protein 2